MQTSRTGTLAALVFILLMVPGCKYILVPTYAIESIGKLPPTELVFDNFNDQSQILIARETDNFLYEYFYWDDGELIPIPSLSDELPVVGLNPRGGVLTNIVTDVSSQPEVASAIYESAAYSDIPLPEIKGSSGTTLLLARSTRGVNLGIHVDTDASDQIRRRLIVWNKSNDYIFLETPPNVQNVLTISFQLFVNDSRTVVGTATDRNRIYYWRNGNPIAETIEGGGLAPIVATGLSKDGTACGFSVGGGQHHGWTYKDSLNFLPNPFGVDGLELATGCNDAGDIVGLAVNVETLTSHLVMWKKHSHFDFYIPINISTLEGLTGNSDYYSTFPRINNRKEILLPGLTGQKEDVEYFVLRPDGIRRQALFAPQD